MIISSDYDEIKTRALEMQAGRFNIGNFKKAEAEIARMMRIPTSTGNVVAKA
jgi:hypothetical protein